MEYKVPRRMDQPDGLRIAIHSTQRVDSVQDPIIAELEGTRMRANSALIAAAPDLLDALKLAYAAIVGDLGYPPGARLTHTETLKVVAEAIARAEGR